ncbi:MAG: chemotaxis protein CheB, partial [Desulfobulbaceae bacterium]|nr:chemotaxis protein CheB [Desulfobulbaceae bacterium]
MIKYKAVVIGVSAGGMNTLKNLFQTLADDFSLPLIIVQHEASYADDFLASYLAQYTTLQVKQADDKDVIVEGCAYIAPPGYHLMV